MPCRQQHRDQTKSSLFILWINPSQTAARSLTPYRLLESSEVIGGAVMARCHVNQSTTSIYWCSGRATANQKPACQSRETRNVTGTQIFNTHTHTQQESIHTYWAHLTSTIVSKVNQFCTNMKTHTNVWLREILIFFNKLKIKEIIKKWKQSTVLSFMKRRLFCFYIRSISIIQSNKTSTIQPTKYY